MKGFVYAILIGTMMLGVAHAQTPEEASARVPRLHSLHFELAGRGFLFGSMNYEYAASPRVSIGIGLGLVNAQTGRITRETDGIPEEGRYLDLSTTRCCTAITSSAKTDIGYC